MLRVRTQLSIGECDADSAVAIGCPHQPDHSVDDHLSVVIGLDANEMKNSI